MKCLVACVLFFYVANSYAQGGFSNYYDFDSGSSFHNVVRYQDTLIAIGTSKNIALNQWGTLWVKMDTSGTIIQQNLLLDSLDGFFAFNQNYPLTLDNENNVALVGNILNRSSIFFQKISTNGEQRVFTLYAFLKPEKQLYIRKK